MTKLSLSHLATSCAVAVLSGLLLVIYPYYPLYVVIILALALGAVGLEFPNIALIVAILLSVLGAMYQDATVGLTFLVVFLITLMLTFHWLDMACVIASWILAFLTPVPWLAIAPTLFAGLHRSRENAVEVGVASGFSIFLLAWTTGMSRVGMMLIPSPSNYVAKAIPNPWGLTGFIPSADAYTTANLASYYAPLTASLADFRIYLVIATWAIAGFLTAFLASKLKGNAYYASTLLGVMPAFIVSFLFAQTSPLGAVAVLAASLVISPAYKYLEPIAEQLNQVRKVATIMFTDIVGYTAITGKDEALALRILAAQKKVLRPVFEKYGGLEIKTIGDAFLVEFTDALSAVNCAVEIQRKLQDQKLAGHETQLHIGIHEGEVIHRAGDVFGDVVNIAARIEPLAQPGEICVSSQVYDQIVNKTDYTITALGPKNLKNVQQPVEVYNVSPGIAFKGHRTEDNDSTTDLKPQIALAPISNTTQYATPQIQLPTERRMGVERISYVFLGIGAVALIFAIAFTSTILTFVGLGLMLWGALFFPRQKYMRSDLTTAFSLKTKMTHGVSDRGKIVYPASGSEKAIVRIGDGLRLMIPPEVASLLRAHEGDEVEFATRNGDVIIRKVGK